VSTKPEQDHKGDTRQLTAKSILASRFFALLIVFSGPSAYSDFDEPCESDELASQFMTKLIIEYEFVADDAFAVVATLPTALPSVKLGGIFLIREEGGKRLLSAPLVPIATTDDVVWTSVSIATALAKTYAIAVTYDSQEPSVDGCWYEFKIPIESSPDE